MSKKALLPLVLVGLLVSAAHGEPANHAASYATPAVVQAATGLDLGAPSKAGPDLKSPNPLWISDVTYIGSENRVTVHINRWTNSKDSQDMHNRKKKDSVKEPCKDLAPDAAFFSKPAGALEVLHGNCDMLVVVQRGSTFVQTAEVKLARSVLKQLK